MIRFIIHSINIIGISQTANAINPPTNAKNPKTNVGKKIKRSIKITK